MGRQLNRVRSAWRRVCRLQERIEQLQAIAEKTTQTLSDMPKGGGEGGTENIWAELADQRQAYEEQAYYYLRAANELEFELSVIKNQTVRAAMECRYVDCMSITKIAQTVHYDTRTVYRLLSKGQAIYEREYNDYEEDGQ